MAEIIQSESQIICLRKLHASSTRFYYCALFTTVIHMAITMIGSASLLLQRISQQGHSSLCFTSKRATVLNFRQLWHIKPGPADGMGIIYGHCTHAICRHHSGQYCGIPVCMVALSLRLRSSTGQEIQHSIGWLVATHGSVQAIVICYIVNGREILQKAEVG